MKLHKNPLQRLAGAAILSGALVFAGCSTGAIGSTSTTTSTSAGSQAQATDILQHVQQRLAQGYLHQADVVSDTSVDQGSGIIGSVSQGSIVFQPFGLNWNTVTDIAGTKIRSDEIVANGNLYVRTDSNAYQEYSLAQLASLAQNTSATSSASSMGAMAAASIGGYLQQFANLTNARVVCDAGSYVSASVGTPSQTSTTSTSNQPCTVAFTPSDLIHTTPGISVTGGTSLVHNGSVNASTMRAYEIQGTATVNSGNVAGTSTTGQGVATETIYVSADGNYQPLGVVFHTIAGSGGATVSLASNTIFENWNMNSTQITPPSNVANG